MIGGHMVFTFNQHATVRYTIDNWTTFEDIECHQLQAKLHFNKSCTVEYAINYGTHWDNNNHMNYKFNYVKKTILRKKKQPDTQSNQKTITFDLSKNMWMKYAN
jgi:hypothetical protein